MVKSVANAGDEAVKTAQKVGVTVEGFQKLAYAAKLSDVSNEQLANGLKFLSRNLVDAAGGGKQTSEAFKKLGIDPKKNLGNTEELLAKIADRFSGMEDGAQKTALAMDIFGRAGGDLIPLLNGGGKSIREAAIEAETFGIVIDQATAKMGEEFNDNLTRTGAILSGLKTVIGSALLPYFHEAVQATIDWFKANRNLVRAKVTEWVGRIVVAARSMAKWTLKVIQVISTLVKKVGGFEGVTKLAAVALGVIAGYKFGSVIEGVINLTREMKKLAREASLAKAALPVSRGGVILASIIGGATLGATYRKEITGFFKSLGLDFIVDGSFVKMYVKAFEAIREHFSLIWRSAVKDAVDFANWVQSIIPESFKTALTSIKDAFVSTFTAIKDFVIGTFREMASNLASTLNPGKSLLDKIGASLGLGGGPSGAFEALRAQVSNLQNVGPAIAIRGSAGAAAGGAITNNNQKNVTINNRAEFKVADKAEMEAAWGRMTAAMLRDANHALGTAAI